MPTDAEESFARYLQAKVTVDDRSLNRRVIDLMKSRFLERRRRRVVEIGVGVGTMAQRLHDWKMVRDDFRYHGIDRGMHGIELARERMAGHSGFSFEQADALSWAPDQPADLVIANAVMDLMELEVALPHFARYCEAGGLYYFSIVFDGETILHPACDADLDATILASYHRDMDDRDSGKSGGSRSGRRLLGALQASSDYRVIAAGSSDWIVHAVDGAYPDDEHYFLSYLIEGIISTVRARSDVSAEALDRWADTRRNQIASGELIFIAHQLDILSERT